MKTDCGKHQRSAFSRARLLGQGEWIAYEIGEGEGDGGQLALYQNQMGGGEWEEHT